MVQLNFDTGLKQYEVNGTVIEFNPADAGLYDRIKTSLGVIDEYTKKYTDIDTPEKLSEQFAEADRIVRSQIDYVFSAPISEKIFGKVNCMSPCTNGKALYENFLDAFMPVLEKDIEDAYSRSGNHIRKYTSQIK